MRNVVEVGCSDGALKQELNSRMGELGFTSFTCSVTHLTTVPPVCNVPGVRRVQVGLSSKWSIDAKGDSDPDVEVFGSRSRDERDAVLRRDAVDVEAGGKTPQSAKGAQGTAKRERDPATSRASKRLR
jgi:hypothetical protein